MRDRSSIYSPDEAEVWGMGQGIAFTFAVRTANVKTLCSHNPKDEGHFAPTENIVSAMNGLEQKKVGSLSCLSQNGKT